MAVVLVFPRTRHTELPFQTQLTQANAYKRSELAYSLPEKSNCLSSCVFSMKNDPFLRPLNSLSMQYEHFTSSKPFLQHLQSTNPSGEAPRNEGSTAKKPRLRQLKRVVPSNRPFLVHCNAFLQIFRGRISSTYLFDKLLVIICKLSCTLLPL